MKLKLWMAPLHGINDYKYREIWFKHFGLIDEVITPFISLRSGNKIKIEQLADLLPENNKFITPIPQLIGNNHEQFIIMIDAMAQLGYKRFNLNLGCPAKNVIKHRRGAGLLQFPETIDNMLYAFYSKTNFSLSVKVRLGNKSKDEIFHLVEILNKYPLEFIVIHPRTASQMYEGEVDLKTFNLLTKQLKHKIVYSGDITSKISYDKLKLQFPNIENFMIGRALIQNPFLPQIIKNQNFDNINNQIFINFYNDLFQNYKIINNNSLQIINKFKEFWKYFILNYKLPYHKEFELLLRTTNEKEFDIYANYLLNYLNFSVN